MPEHNNCDWDLKREMVFSKISDIQEEIKSQSEDIKCLNRKVSDLRADQKANSVILEEIRKNIDEIKNDSKTQSTRNNSKIGQVNVDLGKIQTKFAIYAAIGSLVAATIVSLLLKFAF